jgi:vacuolar protein sorting-associated protein 13A/C
LLILKYLCIFVVWFSEGAKKEGAAGFFKGIGKGLVGVVARPTGGIIDMASSTFQGIQR